MVAARIACTVGDADLEGRAHGLAARARQLMIDRCFVPERGFYADTTSTQNADAAPSRRCRSKSAIRDGDSASASAVPRSP